MPQRAPLHPLDILELNVNLQGTPESPHSLTWRKLKYEWDVTKYWCECKCECNVGVRWECKCDAGWIAQNRITEGANPQSQLVEEFQCALPCTIPVNIVETTQRKDCVRGRIDSPVNGWISLAATDSTRVWATLVKDSSEEL